MGKNQRWYQFLGRGAEVGGTVEILDGGDVPGAVGYLRTELIGSGLSRNRTTGVHSISLEQWEGGCQGHETKQQGGPRPLSSCQGSGRTPWEALSWGLEDIALQAKQFGASQARQLLG